MTSHLLSSGAKKLKIPRWFHGSRSVNKDPAPHKRQCMHTSRWVDTRIATEAWPLISRTGLISQPAALSQSEAETKRSLSICRLLPCKIFKLNPRDRTRFEERIISQKKYNMAWNWSRPDPLNLAYELSSHSPNKGSKEYPLGGIRDNHSQSTRISIRKRTQLSTYYGLRSHMALMHVLGLLF